MYRILFLTVFLANQTFTMEANPHKGSSESFDEKKQETENTENHVETDLKKWNKEKIEENEGSFIPVLMNEYQYNYGTKKALITTGVVDCVVIGYYHPEKKITYLTHLLRSNQFRRNHASNAEKKPAVTRRIDPYKNSLYSEGLSVEETMEKIDFSDNKGIFFLFSHDPYKMQVRQQQIRDSGFTGKIHVYYGANSNYSFLLNEYSQEKDRLEGEIKILQKEIDDLKKERKENIKSKKNKNIGNTIKEKVEKLNALKEEKTSAESMLEYYLSEHEYAKPSIPKEIKEKWESTQSQDIKDVGLTHDGELFAFNFNEIAGTKLYASIQSKGKQQKSNKMEKLINNDSQNVATKR